jgi:protein-S-isoprenylcysteine O-methyltransferase Ste14
MNALELKVPPPVVALLVAAAMWGITMIGAPVEVPDVVRYAAAATFAIAGGRISVAGVIWFRRAKTTVNPLKPENTSSLVTAGIYRVTRNPMYLGLLFVLLAWAVFLL